MTLYQELSEITGEYIPEGKMEEIFKLRNQEGSLDMKTFWKIILVLIRRINDLEKRA